MWTLAKIQPEGTWNLPSDNTRIKDLGMYFGKMESRRPQIGSSQERITIGNAQSATRCFR